MFNLLKIKPLTNLKPLLFAFSSNMGSRQKKQKQLEALIQMKINEANVQVEDTSESGSCGVMYNIFVQSPIFHGKSLVEQHQMVTRALKQELKSIHAINIRTKAIIKEQKTAPPNTPGTGSQQSDGRVVDNNMGRLSQGHHSSSHHGGRDDGAPHGSIGPE